MPKKIQSLSIKVQDLMRLSPSQKVSIFQSTTGARIVSQLTPEQYASLFPRYFLDRLRYDVSGFLQAMSPEARDRLKNVLPGGNTESSTGSGGERQRQPTATAPSIRNSTPSWLKELEKEAPGVGDTRAKGTLTPEQKGAIARLKQGEIAADDPSVAFLAKQTPEARRAAGIETIERDGKQLFQYRAVTDEEAKSRIASGPVREGSEGLKGRAQLAKATYDSFIQAGLSDKQARAVVAQVNRENSLDPKNMFGTHAEHASHVRGRTNYGIFSWGDPTRAKNFVDFMKQNGIMDRSGKVIADNDAYLKAQARFAVQEMRGTRAGQKFLENPDISTTDADNLLGRHIGWDMAGRRHNLSKSLERMAEGRRIIDEVNSRFPGTLPENATPEQIEAARAKIEEERESSIAVRPQLPQGLDPKFVEQYNNMPVGQAQRVAAAIAKIGPEKFNESFQKEPEKAVNSVSNSTNAASASSLGPSSNVVQTQSEVARDRKLDIKKELEGYLDYASRQTPGVRFIVTSGGQKKGGPTAGGPRHNVDNPDTIGAADGYLEYRDPNTGKTRRLDVSREEDKPLIQQFTRNFARHAPNAGVGAGYMPGPNRDRLFHFGGGRSKDDPPIAYAGPVWFKEAFNEGRSSFGKEDTKKEYQAYLAQRAEEERQYAQQQQQSQQQVAQAPAQPQPPSRVVMADEATQREIVQQGIASVFGDPAKARERAQQQAAQTQVAQAPQAPAQPAVPAQVGTPQQPFVPPAPAGQVPTATPVAPAQPAAQPEPAQPAPARPASTTPSQRQAPAVPAQVGTPQQPFVPPAPAARAAQTEAQGNRIAVASASPTTTNQEGQQQSDGTITVEALYDGGNKIINRNTEKVEAHPIDYDNRNSNLKGDDAIVVDAKSRDPLFTMNTTRETAIFDPESQSISVKPVDKKSDEEPKTKNYVSVAKPDSLSVPLFSMDTTDGTAKKYDPSTRNVNNTDVSNAEIKNKQSNKTASQISKASIFVKDKELPDDALVPVLADGGEVSVSNEQTQQSDNNINAGSMGAMQTSSAQSIPNPTAAFSMASNPSFECPSFVRACGAVNGQRSSDPFGGHYDKFASNLA